MPEQTQVRFDLWAVLAFIFLAGAVAVGFLYADQKETKTKQQEVLYRIVKIESQYDYIISGLDKLTKAVEESADKREKYRTETRKTRNENNK